MKPVFKCDYCSKIGTEEEIREHEPECTDNYDRKNCHTCTHGRLTMKDKQWYYECKIGIEIPEGRLFEFCPSYERKVKEENPLGDLFSGLFGG